MTKGSTEKRALYLSLINRRRSWLRNLSRLCCWQLCSYSVLPWRPALVSTGAAAEGVASTAVEVSTVAGIVMGMAAVATADITATAGVTATVDVTATAGVTATAASCVVEHMAMAVDMAIPVLQDTIILMASVYRTN